MSLICRPRDCPVAPLTRAARHLVQEMIRTELTDPGRHMTLCAQLDDLEEAARHLYAQSIEGALFLALLAGADLETGMTWVDIDERGRVDQWAAAASHCLQGVIAALAGVEDVHLVHHYAALDAAPALLIAVAA